MAVGLLSVIGSMHPANADSRTISPNSCLRRNNGTQLCWDQRTLAKYLGEILVVFLPLAVSKSGPFPFPFPFPSLTQVLSRQPQHHDRAPDLL